MHSFLICSLIYFFNYHHYILDFIHPVAEHVVYLYLIKWVFIFIFSFIHTTYISVPGPSGWKTISRMVTEDKQCWTWSVPSPENPLRVTGVVNFDVCVALDIKAWNAKRLHSIHLYLNTVGKCMHPSILFRDMG